MSFSFLENYNQDTLIVLGFAVLLLLFLFILIIVTINVLKGDNSAQKAAKKAAKEAKKAAKNGEIPESEGTAESEEANAEEDAEEEEEPAEEEVELTEEEIEDETSRMVQEAVAAVEATKAKIEAERKEREAAEAAIKRNAAKASEDEEDFDDDYEDDEEEAVTEDDFEAEDNDNEEDEEPDMLLGDVEEDYDYDDDDYDDEVDEPTGELDTVRIREALKKAQQESRDTEQDAKSVEFARERAEAPEYDASFDSAFVSKPSLEEDKPEPVIPNPTVESMKINIEEEASAAEEVAEVASDVAETGAEAAEDVAAESIAETAAEVTAAAAAVEAVEEAESEAPKKKKKKKGEKKPLVKPASAPTGEDGKPKYFWYNTQDTDGLEKKEDMFYYCHYFADPDSAVIPLITEMYDCGFVRTEEIMRIAYGVDFQAFDMGDILDSDDGGFDMSKVRKQPTEEDRREIYKLWKRYVNRFHKIIVINSQDDVEEYIIRKMYAYGKKDAKELLYSPM